jgi:predicted dehydrogenase
MNDTIRWGIIGCGDVTEIKSGPALQKVEGSELVAVMRRSADKARDYAERHGVPHWYSDADKLIADPRVNAIYIATPPDSHADYTQRAARAKKPVYVEKPMARTYAECQAVVAACKQADVPLFVAYYRRAMPYFLKVKELLDSSAIGAVHSVHIALHQRPMAVDPQALPWRIVPAISGGGLFFDLASHQLDLLDFLLGPIAQAQGVAANRAGHYAAEDTVSASFAFAAGPIGSGSWSFCASEGRDQIEILGAKGRIVFSTFQFTPIELVNDQGQQTFAIDLPEHVQQPLIQTVVDALLGQGTCPSSGESGARTSRIMEQIIYGLNA